MSNKKTLWIPLAGSMMLLLLLALTILPTSSAPSLAVDSPQAPADVEGTDQWSWLGPSHNAAAGMAPHAIVITIDRSYPNIVYAGTNQGVYRSTDTGSTWEPRNVGLGGYGGLNITDLEIDPTNHQRLLIGTWGYGLALSTDSGLHWTRLADPLASADLQPSAALPPGAPQVRAGGASDIAPVDAPDLLKESPFSSVLSAQRLPAAGEQVESPQGLPGSLPWTPVRDVAINPANASQFFACVDLSSLRDGGVYVSNNSGSSWTPVTNLPDAYCRAYTFAPTSSAVRYASFGTWDPETGSLYRTLNGGDSWTEVGSPEIEHTVTAVAIHPTNYNIVLAATYGGGIYRSTNGGDTWTNVSTPSSLPDVGFHSVAFAPGNPNVAYAGGHEWGVYRSDDAGATWTDADPSFPTRYIQGLAIHPSTTASTVLVGARYEPYGGVYRRTSDGSAFALAATGMTDTFVLDIEQDPNNASRLYAATWGGGTFRSDNGGATWDLQLSYPYVISLEATEGPTGTILYGGTFYNTYGVIKSWDQGQTWWALSWNGEDNIIESYDIMSLDGGPDHLVAATHWGVEYSDDGAKTWEDATGLDEGLVLKLAQSPNDPNDFLAATFGGGVWSSGNGGISWSESSAGLGSPYVYDVAYSAAPYNTAYAASLGVYRSENGGGSWFPAGLSGSYIRAVDTVGGPGYDVFAGTVDRGVYMAPERTNWWLNLNAGLGELRILSLLALDYDTLFTGTNGRGAWEYTIAHRPRPMILVPLIMKNHGTVFVPLVNGDFEQGPTVGWGQSADHGYNIILNDDPLPVDAHSGSWLTLLGSAFDNFSVIWQDATIPTSDPWVRFYRWDASEDFCGYDWAAIYIDGSPVAGWDLCADENTGGWVWSGVDLSAYAGQTVEVAIGAYTDGSLNSNSFIDDVTLGYFGSPDPGVQQAPPDLNESTLLLMLPDLDGAQKFTSEPPFRPSGIPSDLPGLVDLSD